MKRNYKSLLSIALVLLLVAITSLTFAFWDQLTGSEEGTVNIGEGKRVTITETLAVDANQRLVPSGVVMGTSDVNSITVKYNVAVTELVTGYHLDVSVTTGHALLIANTTIGEFVNEVAEVTIVFTLGMPADSTTYGQVANQPLTYTINFDYNNIV